MGCVRGFCYFSLYLRGREELLVSVQPTRSPDGNDDAPFLMRAGSSAGGSTPLFDATGVRLPPASPADARTPASRSDATTVFLVAGYARYKCPFVWLRSKTHRLRGVSPDIGLESPLQLKTTDAWAESNIRVWDIIEELVHITFASSLPTNAFAMDARFFAALEPFERFLATGAALNMLRKLYLVRTDQPCAAGIAEDMRVLARMHYDDAPSVIPLTAGPGPSGVVDDGDDE